MDELARDNIAFVPFFPLGGFSPLQSAELPAAERAILDGIAARTAPAGA